MRTNPLLFILCLLFLWSCKKATNTVNGSYAPVYAKLSELSNIATVAAQATARPGKIYAYGNYIFQNDINTGIHIIDNSVPANPRKVAFLRIPYTTEIAIKGNYLYTNSVSDLLVFDMTSAQQPQLVKRVTNAFPIINQDYPSMLNVYYECPDPEKGIVVDWELKQTPNANCKR